MPGGFGRVQRWSINLEKAVNHGEHSEKTMGYIGLASHPMGGVEKLIKPRFFDVLAVSPWFELRFLELTDLAGLLS